MGQEDKYIIKSFPFFFEKMENQVGFNVEMMQIHDEFIVERIAGSGTFHLCQDEIIAELYKSLQELADASNSFIQQTINVERLPFLVTQNNKETLKEQAVTLLEMDLKRAEERADKESWIDADDLERELV